MPEIEEVRPAYYGPGGVYEPVKVIDAWGLSFRVGTALAYMARAGKKPGVSAIEDLRKAHTFLGMEIAKILESGEDTAQKQTSHGTDMPILGSKNRLIFDDSPQAPVSGRPGGVDEADSAREWVEKSAEFLAQKHSVEVLVAETKAQAQDFVHDSRVRFVLLAYWRACQKSMTSRDWRRLLMSLPIEVRREIMAWDADRFLERLDDALEAQDDTVERLKRERKDYEGMPMEEQS